MLYASSIFPGNADAKLREVEKWLKDKGVRDFEPVGLTVSQMSKVRLKVTWNERDCNCCYYECSQPSRRLRSLATN